MTHDVVVSRRRGRTEGTVEDDESELGADDCEDAGNDDGEGELCSGEAWGNKVGGERIPAEFSGETRGDGCAVSRDTLGGACTASTVGVTGTLGG